MKSSMHFKQKKKSYNGIRLVLFFGVIITAMFLKKANPKFLLDISETICESLKVEEAIDVVSFKGSNDVVEVFAEADAIMPDDAYEEYYNEVYNIKKANEEFEIKRREEERRRKIENLSFQMSEDELHDNTKAEPFRIPPPKSCSYEKPEINFSYQSPLKGVLTSAFGYRDHPLMNDSNFHTGIDIAAASGKSIVAFADGIVKESGRNSTYGNYLLIEHSDGVSSFYGHNSKLFVKKGTSVKRGQKVAAVGSTGMSTGPHLHFEIRKYDKRINPALYIS